MRIPSPFAPSCVKRRSLALLVLCGAVAMLVLPLVCATQTEAAPVQQAPAPFGRFVNNDSAGPTDEADELQGMSLAPVDPNADPESVLRARPFVITESSYPALTAGGS